jgi:prepilin-type N-terminal cleavage/methylation domain-containing protein
MRTKLLNEKGLTLIESLLSLVLFSIIGTVVYFVLLTGMNTEKKIYTETLIRDEADLVMSQIIDALYMASTSKVTKGNGNQNVLVYQVNQTKNKTVGFIDDQPMIDGKLISSEDFDFKDSSIILENKSVKIELKVKSKKNKSAKKLSLQSQFRLMEE